MDKYLVRTSPSLAPARRNHGAHGTKPTVVELYAGAGGMALGLEAAGFEHVALIERDRQAVHTLRNNGFGKRVLCADAQSVDYSRWQGVDLVAGGPPCQPFSAAGLDRGADDPRDGWPTAARAVAEIRPRAFVLENVAGMLRDKFASYFDTVLERFWNLGYVVHVHCVDAADYGVPQHRKRIFMVGFREIHWFPKPPPVAKHVTVGDVFASLGPPNGQNGHSVHRVVPRRAADGTTDAMRDASAKRVAEGCSAPRAYGTHTGSALDKPAKALTAGCSGASGGCNMVRLKDGTLRYFTPREQARLQGFPDSYKVHAVWSYATRQMGNACPVPLAEVFGRGVLAILNKGPHQGRPGNRVDGDDSDLAED